MDSTTPELLEMRERIESLERRLTMHVQILNKISKLFPSLVIEEEDKIELLNYLKHE